MPRFPDAERGIPTLVDVLRTRAETLSTKAAFSMAEERSAGDRVTYADLDRQARAIAVALLDRARPGDRVLLLIQPGIDYVAALFGTLYAGMVAVPAYPPERARLGKSIPRLLAVLRDAGCALVCTRESVDPADRAMFDEGGVTGLRWLAIRDLSQAQAAHWQPPALTDRSIAVLQYTSGSTGDPKGVVLTHRNLSAGSAVITRSMGIDGTNHGVSWLPPFHDMGLIGGLLQSVWAGASTTLLAPLTFLRDPFSWLSAISGRERVVSGGPNFAFDWCVRRTTPEQRAALDLSGWRVAFCGAEPIRPQTLRAFTEAFAPAGFSASSLFPCYGLAEATLLVTGASAGRGTRATLVRREDLELGRAVIDLDDGPAGRAGVPVMGCGVAAEELSVHVVSPTTSTPCAPLEVGEIWVSGPAVADGYWCRPEETATVFGGTLPGRLDRYLRTGDLGFMDADGELFVTGRIKDLIVIRGRNHYPADIERTVQHSSPVFDGRLGAAFAVPTTDGEQLVVVHEVEPAALSTPDRAQQVVAAARAAVSDLHGVQVSTLVAVRPRSIPKTTSGKVRRRACREAFLAGALAVIGTYRSPDPAAEPDAEALPTGAGAETAATGLRTWLLGQLARAAGVPPSTIDLSAPFTALGFDSAGAVSMAARLQEQLGRPVPATVFYDYPTPAELLEHLQATAGGPATETAPRPVLPERTPVGDIAIVGIGLRLPGGVQGPDDFWDLLRRGADATGTVPAGRWPDRPAARGGFLDDVTGFDAALFSISPREASRMDPQQRMVLEVAWQAIEHAGYPPLSLRGSQTGVIIGISSFDYARTRFDPGNPDEWGDPFAGTGNAHSIAANRLSYLLGLQGPSLAVDTACSSSLVGVHLAVQSLLTGECDLVLAGGVNALLAPDVSDGFARAGMLSASGRCRTFDADADGYGRGEGCGMVVLKRLADAVRDGDVVHAVIRGTAVNHDGTGNGLTAPSGGAQARVIGRALAVAGLDPAQVGYVEAHGTGTPLGDPIEIAALQSVYGRDRAADRPLLVGSVKTNVGHLESAAGIVGLIKAALAVRHGLVPAHLNLERVNPEVAKAGPAIRVPAHTVDWPADGPRLAGVSSFGFGGTNAHAVLSEPPTRPAAALGPDTSRILPISAATEAGLDRMVEKFSVALTDPAAPSWDDAATTAARGRSPLRHRLAVVAGSGTAAARALRAGTGVIRGRVEGQPPRIGFMYAGQGGTRSGLARELHAAEPVFAAALERAAALADPDLGHHLLDLLVGEPVEAGRTDVLTGTGYAQPALFAVEHALTALWASWGIVPDMVLGHSVGELVAACTAGVLSLPDAGRLIATRAQLMHRLPAGGEMHVVHASVDQLAPLLAAHPGVAIAAVNGPANTVLSGPADALAPLLGTLDDRGVTARPLAVSHAFHSALMDPVLAPFRRFAETVPLDRPHIPIVSTLSGSLAGDELTRPGYWSRQVREPVQFAAALAEMAERVDILVELGPSATLAALARDQHPGKLALASMHAGRPAVTTLQTALATLWTRGAPVSWNDRTHQGRRAILPTYAFDHVTFRADRVDDRPNRGATRARPAGTTASGLPEPVGLASGQSLFAIDIDSSPTDFLADHRVHGRVVAPAACYLSLALAGADHPHRDAEVVDAAFPYPMIIGADEGRRMQMLVTPSADGGRAAVSLHSSPFPVDAGSTVQWQKHFTASAGPARASGSAGRPPADPLDGTVEAVGGRAFYQQLAEHGFDYGPSFRWVGELIRLPGQARSRLTRPAAAAGERWQVLTGFLDGCFQTLAAAVGVDPEAPAGVAHVPVAVERIVVSAAAPGDGWCTATVRPAGRSGGIVGDIEVRADDGTVVTLVQGLELAALPAAAIGAAVQPQTLRVAWEQVPQNEFNDLAEPAGRWLILADRTGVGDRLAARLTRGGATCLLVDTATGTGPVQTSDADPARRRVDPHQPGAWTALLDEPGDGDWSGVVNLWALDTTDLDPLDGFAHSCGSAAELVQALRGRGAGTPPVWHITSGAQPIVANRALHPTQAALWGLARVLMNENPAAGGGLIDLDPSAAHAAVDLLPAAFAARSGTGQDRPADDQLAVADGRWWRPRLRVDSAADRPAPVALDPAAGYLITGGLGALGCLVARELADRGARQLTLLTRNPDHPEAEPTIADLRAAGVRVTVAIADVADPPALAAAIAAANDAAPLRGVVHAAGVASDGHPATVSLPEMIEVVRPKVAGAYQLDRLTRHLPLDFFVLFSSVAATLGPPGQGAYAAGNSYLDTLAAARLAAGLPATAIGWGPWAGPGLAAAHQRTHAAAGFTPLPADTALQHLDTGGSAGRGHVLVSITDWARYAAVTGRPPLLAALLPSQPAGRAPAVPRITQDELRRLPADRRLAFVTGLLLDLVGDALDLPRGELDPQTPLHTVGLDSLLGLELRHRIETSLQVRLPMATLLERPSVLEIARLTLVEIGDPAAEPDAGHPADDPTEPAPAADEQELLASLDELTEAELDLMIGQLEHQTRGMR